MCYIGNIIHCVFAQMLTSLHYFPVLSGLLVVLEVQHGLGVS